MPAKFNLGQIVATSGAIDALNLSAQSATVFLARHVTGDWGDVCKEDRQSNDDAVANEGDADKQSRVLSQYSTGNGTVLWIITEWDRSYTTLLLPAEY